MEEIKNFMLHKKDVNQDFDEEAIQKVKNILIKNNLSTAPVISITVSKNTNLDFKDFIQTLNNLNGLYYINSSCLMRTVKISFINFYHLLKFLCLNSFIEKQNGLQLLNISFRKIQRNKHKNSQNQTEDKENNLNLSQKLSNKKIKKEQKKLTGRFYLQIPNNVNFPLAKKIIGKQGKNMKAIINECKALTEQSRFSKDFLKLRLRGKGSFHKEGSKRKECNDQLHLCVSAKDSKILKRATELIEKLLSKIFKEYTQFCKVNDMISPKRFYTKVFESHFN